MSLTVFTDERRQEVAVLQWFKDPRFSVSYPSGPLRSLSQQEFRRTGFDLVRQHCEEFSRLRLEEANAVPVFSSVAEERKFLKKQIPVSIANDFETGGFILGPLSFRKYDLGGMVSLGAEHYRRLPWNCSEAEFWECFDDVLHTASS